MGHVHTTKVRIDLVELRKLTKELEQKSLSVGGKPKSRTDSTSAQRSAFCAFNNINHFLKRVDDGSDSTIIEVSGKSSGASARVYYNPSITSLAKVFRRCIKPLNPDNIFLFFDLKAAEFFLNCYFCGEVEALKAYERGEDIYMPYSNLFPPNTSREIIKKVMIANMYNVTPYRVALDCGISEGQAEYLLTKVARSIPHMTDKKKHIIQQAKRLGYVCPNGLDESKLVKISDIEGEFKENLALSTYVQSALGLWVTQFIKTLESNGLKGTLLTVFDSFLIETSPANAEHAKEWLSKNMKPFRTGSIKEAKSFYDACVD